MIAYNQRLRMILSGHKYTEKTQFEIEIVTNFFIYQKDNGPSFVILVEFIY